MKNYTIKIVELPIPVNRNSIEQVIGGARQWAVFLNHIIIFLFREA